MPQPFYPKLRLNRTGVSPSAVQEIHRKTKKQKYSDHRHTRQSDQEQTLFTPVVALPRMHSHKTAPRFYHWFVSPRGASEQFAISAPRPQRPPRPPRHLCRSAAHLNRNQPQPCQPLHHNPSTSSHTKTSRPCTSALSDALTISDFSPASTLSSDKFF